MRGWGDLPPPHPLSACADAELPASPPPLFYNVGNGERRQEGSSAQTDAGEGVRLFEDFIIVYLSPHDHSLLVQLHKY